MKIVNLATRFGQLYIVLLLCWTFEKNSSLDAEKTAATAEVVFNSFQEKMITTDPANCKLFKK